MSVFTSSWLARRSGAMSILARPLRVRLGPRRRSVAAVFRQGAADDLLRPGASWILENGSFSIHLTTYSAKPDGAGSFLVLAGGRADSEG
jgi:hypothetical protein